MLESEIALAMVPTWIYYDAETPFPYLPLKVGPTNTFMLGTSEPDSIRPQATVPMPLIL